MVRPPCSSPNVFSWNLSTPRRPQGPAHFTGPCELPDPSRRFNLAWRGRNVDLLSIDYAFRPCLRSRLTLGGFTFPRKPWTFGERDSHSLYRYSSWHIHLLPLQSPSRNPFDADSDAPLPSIAAATDSVQTLIPDNYRRQIPRPVSCYALFKWWLLLSQHPGCHSILTTFSTEHDLGTLADGPGCFPFDHEDYPS